MEYRYDAFISYRHSALDKYVATNLHRLLETYTIPKNIVEKYNLDSNKIKRVFRDQEELPISSNLEEHIVKALEQSRFLIVICSPRLKESIWCRKEIETFIKFHGRKNILCVLIEGEPADSFPEELLEYKEVVDGKEIIKNVEPLAADVRDINKKQVYKKIKEEVIRIVAAMFNLYYDDLKQREQLRKMKKVIRISIISTIVFLLFAIYSLIMIFKINSQQEKLLINQALNLSNESIESFNKDNKKYSILKAKEALTNSLGIKMPYTSQAHYALVKSLDVYDIGKSYKALDQFNTNGIVKSIKTNNDYMLSYDESGVLTLWDLKTRSIIKTYNDIMYDENGYSFLNDDKFVYISNTGIKINDLNGNLIKLLDIKSSINKPLSFKIYNDKIFVKYYSSVELYDLNSYEVLYSYNCDKKYNILSEYNLDDNFIVFSSSELMSSNILLHIYNIKSKNLETITLDSNIIKQIDIYDNKLLILTNSYTENLSSNIIYYDLLKNQVIHNISILNTQANFFRTNNNLVIISTYSSAYVYDYVKGSFIDIISFGNPSINIYKASENYFISIQENGEVHFINFDTLDDIVYLDLFDLKMDKYSIFQNSNIGFLAVPYNDNRIILYNKKQLDYKKIDYEDKKRQELYDFKEILDKYEFENESLIKSICIGEDLEMYVTYSNNKMNIYKENQLLNTVTLEKGKMKYYLGKDKEGNIYLTDYIDGYVLNKNYELISYIKYLYDINKENNEIILRYSNEYYSLAIYGLDELLNKE